MIPNSTQASLDRAPRPAAQPMTGGSAPGIAPITVASDERRFKGV